MMSNNHGTVLMGQIATDSTNHFWRNKPFPSLQDEGCEGAFCRGIGSYLDGIPWALRILLPQGEHLPDEGKLEVSISCYEILQLPTSSKSEYCKLSVVFCHKNHVSPKLCSSLWKSNASTSGARENAGPWHLPSDNIISFGKSHLHHLWYPDHVVVHDARFSLAQSWHWLEFPMSGFCQAASPVGYWWSTQKNSTPSISRSQW